MLLVAGAHLTGCGSHPYELAPARRQVTLDGEPITGAKVMFAPVAKNGSQKSGKPAFGMLERGGEFTLSTYQPDDGAVVGVHWVTVIRVEPPRRGADGKKSRGDAEAWERVTYPEQVTVNPTGENRFSIPLTSKIVQKYGQTGL